MSKAESLYRLQVLDSQLDQAMKRLKEIEVAILSNAAVSYTKAELEKAEKLARTSAIELKTAEMDAQTLDAKIVDNEQRLYSGAIKAAKEMLDTQKELESLKKRRLTLDDALLGVMQTADDARQAEEHCRKASADAVRKWQEDNAHIRAESKDLVEKVNGLREQRQALVLAIPRADLDVYVNLRTKKSNGVAVALLKSGSCGQCGETPSSMMQQQARTGSTLTMCIACGRVLYGM